MSEILGIGTDLCSISRMEPLTKKAHFMERCFTEQERAWLQSRGVSAAQSMAGLWAAKEAVCKALGCGIAFPLTDLNIRHTESGAPFCEASGEAAERLAGCRVHLSVSHEGDMASAFCVIEKI